MLTNERIDELSNRKGVRKIAVQNFLGTLSLNETKGMALSNLAIDSRLYKWNAATNKAISIGIGEYYR